IFLFSVDNYSLVILAAESCASTLASNSCHSSQRDTRRANIGALTVQGAVTEVGFQIVDHVAGTTSTLFLAQRHQRQVNKLGTSKQVCCTVWTSCHTSTTANAGSVVKRKLSGLVVLVQGICVWCSTCIHGHISTLLHDVVEGTTVNNHVLDDRVRSGAEWL